MVAVEGQLRELFLRAWFRLSSFRSHLCSLFIASLKNPLGQMGAVSAAEI
jgi:hypothetical protein